jgi:tRNA modification GTPase
MDLEDTIVAVSSPAGPAERAILRLSGPDAVAVGDRLFRPNGGATLSDWRTYTAAPGRMRLTGPPCEVPATAYFMRAPRSYTRQDVVELHVGAWPALEGPLVESVLAAGARAAEPGEFTFRAFLMGRLDLAQAEAVMAVVSASGESALRAAGDLLRGHLSRDVAAVAERVRDALVRVEADLDFSDQGIEPTPSAEVARQIASAAEALVRLGRRSRGLETCGGEVRLVLAGRPNAGKSSLFNRLLHRDRAIVTPVPGTTRDEISAAFHVAGPSGRDYAFVLSDTAGLEPAGDDLSAKARDRAVEAIGRADLVLLTLDATSPQDGGMDEILRLVAAPLVVAVTKCDLAPVDPVRERLVACGVEAPVVATSAVTGQGLEELRHVLARAVEGGAVDREAGGPVVTARHRSALETSLAALDRATHLARDDAGGELVAEELREGLDALGVITGRRAGRDVLDGVFSRFCIGK